MKWRKIRKRNDFWSGKDPKQLYRKIRKEKKTGKIEKKKNRNE